MQSAYHVREIVTEYCLFFIFFKCLWQSYWLNYKSNLYLIAKKTKATNNSQSTYCLMCL